MVYILFAVYCVLNFKAVEKRQIMRISYFIAAVVLASIVLLSGCMSSEQSSDGESNSSLSITENPFKNDDQSIQYFSESTDASDVVLGVYKPSVKIAADNDDWHEKKVNIRVNSINTEENSIDGIDYKEVRDIYDGLNEDMSLKDDFVFITANVSLLCDESIDEVNLSTFKIEFTYDGESYTSENSYQSEKLYNDDPHRESVINLDANQEKSIDIGFIAPKEILGADNIQFIAAFQSMAVEMGENPYEGAAIFNLTSEIVK